MSEASTSRAMWKNVRASLVIGGLQAVCGLLLGFAKRQGLIDIETTLRGAMVIVGVGLAAAGNRIPKSSDGPSPSTLKLAVLRQSVMRTAGWSLMLGGLAFAGLWAFAPLAVAQVAATIALGGSLAVMSIFVTTWIYAYHRSPTR
jgi:sterol desaturase/sphingolipid hydroxylase (fatty acid hydroxylase superfamily)